MDFGLLIVVVVLLASVALGLAQLRAEARSSESRVKAALDKARHPDFDTGDDLRHTTPFERIEQLEKENDLLRQQITRLFSKTNGPL